MILLADKFLRHFFIVNQGRDILDTRIVQLQNWCNLDSDRAPSRKLEAGIR